MNISLKSLVAGAALSASVCAVILGVASLTEQPASLSLSYIGGGAVVFKLALRSLLPRSSLPDRRPTEVPAATAKTPRKIESEKR